MSPPHHPPRRPLLAALAVACGLAMAGAAAPATAASVSYRVVDLGADVSPLDVNDARTVVGSRHLPDGTSIGFRFSARTVMQDLPGTTAARAVDTAGRNVGSRPGGAFVFVFDGSLRPLGDGIYANGLNDVGVAAAGVSGVNPFRPSPLPLNPALCDLDQDLWQAQDVARVYPRGTQPGVYADVYLLVDVNDGGAAVGNKSRTGLHGASVIMTAPDFDAVTFMSIPNGRATAINNLGQFVGSADADTPYGLYGQANWHNGSMLLPLGTLDGGLSSSANDVNEQDQVVGSSWLLRIPTIESDPAKYRAFVWQNGQMIDHRFPIGR